MNKNIISYGILMCSILTLTACNSNSSGGNSSTTAAATAVEVSDANRNCTAATASDFIQTAHKVEDSEKDTLSVQKLQEAGKSCDQFQSFLGDKSCLLTFSTPQIQISKNTLGYACDEIAKKLNSTKLD